MQGPAIRLAKGRGWEAFVVDGDPNAPCASWADRFEAIDLKDKTAIEAFARSLVSSGGLDGVLTAGTDFSATVAWVAERLGLPGIPYEVALNASDKSRMRARFSEAGVPSPRFLVVSSLAESAGKLPFDFPVVVKPVDNMGARGCRRADDPASLSSAVADALSYSRSGRAIVEEFMDGPEFSVDALVSGGKITICGLADRHIYFPPYFIEMGHTMPTSVPSDVSADILAVFERGVRALGIENGAAKGDVKLTSRGPMIGEIAARLSGGYMSGWTYPYASGVEPTDGALSIAVGEVPSGLEPKRSWTCAERAFISIPGTVSEILGVETARKSPGVNDLFLRIMPGSKVSFPVNNVSKCGNVIASASDRAVAVRSAEDAARSVLIRLVLRDPDTESFLSAAPGIGSFPPSCFGLTAELAGALSLLPDPEPAAAGGQLPAVVPFPAFTASGLTDYVGRGVGETIQAAEALLGRRIVFADDASADGRPVIGARFWRALVRGGYQGAVYVLESLAASGGALR